MASLQITAYVSLTEFSTCFVIFVTVMMSKNIKNHYNRLN